MNKDELYDTMREYGLSVPGDPDHYSGGGRYYRSNGHRLPLPRSVEEILYRALQGLRSDDPLERVLAAALIDEAAHMVSLPLERTWVVYSTYKSGWGGEGRIALWTAHASEDETRRWRDAVHEHWERERPGRNDYDTKYGLAAEVTPDGVAPHYLRRPDAEVKFR